VKDCHFWSVLQGCGYSIVQDRVSTLHCIEHNLHGLSLSQMSRTAMNSLWRSLSGASGKEISHTHPSSALRPAQSIDVGECEPSLESDGLSPPGCASHAHRSIQRLNSSILCLSCCRHPRWLRERRIQGMQLAANPFHSGERWQPLRYYIFNFQHNKAYCVAFLVYAATQGTKAANTTCRCVAEAASAQELHSCSGCNVGR
jgi:hypothetical protein